MLSRPTGRAWEPHFCDRQHVWRAACGGAAPADAPVPSGDLMGFSLRPSRRLHSRVLAWSRRASVRKRGKDPGPILISSFVFQSRSRCCFQKLSADFWAGCGKWLAGNPVVGLMVSEWSCGVLIQTCGIAGRCNVILQARADRVAPVHGCACVRACGGL